MKPELHEAPNPACPSAREGGRRRFFLLVGGLLLLYLVTAYVVLPLAWRTDMRRHPNLAGSPDITHTASGIPGDPLNIGLVGSEADVIRSMTAAKWYPADPITFRSSVRIAVDSVLRRPDDDAPVSNLYLFGRKQDLAFEQPVGDSPRQRHHVRFWHSDKLDEGRTVWFGSATFDVRVGLSHTTGEVTHHIGPNVDAERDRIVDELRKAGEVQEVYWVDHFHRQLEGRNEEGPLAHGWPPRRCRAPGESQSASPRDEQCVKPLKYEFYHDQFDQRGLRFWRRIARSGNATGFAQSPSEQGLA